MQLTVKFSYVEQVIPPRCRKPRPQRFDDGVIDLYVREVTGEQAPVAIISREKDLVTDALLAPIEYRWFDGRLWTDRRVMCCTAKGAHRYPELGTTLDLVNTYSLLVRHELGIFVAVAKGRKAIAEHLEQCAGDWLMIDGQLYQPAGEPMYLVMTFGLGNDHGGTALGENDFLNSNIKPEAYFSLLELEKARDYARKVAANRGDTRKVSTDPSFQFQVLITEAIQWKNPAAGDDTGEAA